MMDQINALDFLKRRFSDNKKRRIELFINKALAKPGRVQYGTFSGIHFHHFLYHYYIDKDIDQAKQNLSIAGMCADWGDARAKGAMMLYNWTGPSSMLISDNPLLLENYKNWDFGYDTELHELGKIDGPFAISTFILCGDYDKAYKAIERFKLNRLYNEGRVKPLISIMQEDKDGLITYIRSISTKEAISQHIKEGGNEIRAHLYSEYGTYLLKVAWILGMEIEIDNPYIPMDLMPIRPLDKYDIPYFFLEGYEGELPESYKRFLAGKVPPEESPKSSTTSRWTSMIQNNPLFKGAKIKNTIAIEYKNEEGETVIENLTPDDIPGRFVQITLPSDGTKEWVKIPNDFQQWDTDIYKSRAEAFMILCYQRMGYTAERESDGGWDIYR